MEIKNRYCLFFIISFLFTLFYAYPCFAQNAYRGVVTDAETGMAVETANVQLISRGKQKLINYTLTDDNGEFSIPVSNQTDSLEIIVSILGYETVRFPAVFDKKMHIKLNQKVFAIREVDVRPGRVWGQRDTMNYDVAQFLSAKDDAIKDVIKKLPGVDINDLGQISYKGKNISNFYVEGLDVTDGKYGQITNNLDARAVDKIQVLENHQPIRILKDKLRTEDVAINLKLKDNFRDKWMTTIKAGAGASSSSVLWDANLYALQLSRKNQSTYGYKGNNRGADVTDEMNILTSASYNELMRPATPSFLSMPSLVAPLKKEKMLFNNMHTLSANRLYKLNETTKLQINAAYVHDERKQERGSETTFYQADDSIRIGEQSKSRIRTDRGELNLLLENNADNRFLTNRFKTTGSWNRGFSRFSGNQNVDQRILTDDLMARNEFKSLWNRDQYTYELQSYIRYNHSPGELKVDDTRQRLHTNDFYTDNSFALFRQKGYIRHRYMAGIKARVNNIRNGYTPYFIPNWQFVYRKWQIYMNVPVEWANYPGSDFSRFAVNPSLSVIYKYNYAWQFSASANYRQNYGDILEFYDRPYRQNYLYTIIHNGELSTKRLQTYSVYGEYKNTMHEFFATLRLTYNRNWSDQMREQIVEQNNVTLISRNISNIGYGWTLRGTLSKSFYDWKLKASLDYRLTVQNAEMISGGERLEYQSRYMLYEPKIYWSPSARWETGYEGSFRYGGNRIGESTKLTPLWNIVQKLYVSYDLFPIEFKLSADHYYNDVSKEESVNAFFLDGMIRWKSGTWEVDLSVNNLFDKKQYSYTEYSSLQSYTSWINIRGREFLVSARYKF